MKRLLIPLIMAVGLVVLVFGTMNMARGQADSGEDTLLRHEAQGENIREVLGSGSQDASAQPSISFIDSPSATCYQPDSTKDACYLNWYYMSVSASPNYMITMTVSVAPLGYVANVQGFFQTSMYIPYNMLGPGFKVACGELNASTPGLGNAYAYTIRARDSAGLKSANYGTVYCPAYQP